MIGAIVAALAVIVFVWVLTRFQHRDVENPVETIDYTGQLAAAREQAPFDVLSPPTVPDGWRATSAEWDGVGPEVSWHLGFLTGEETTADYVGIEQGNAPEREFLAAVTPAQTPGDPVDVGGVDWQSYTDDSGETALVLTGDEVTTVVTGTVPVDELADFAASLTAE